MSVEVQEQLHISSSERRSLGYTDSFKEFVRQNPGILSKARDLIHDMSYSGKLSASDTAERDGIYIEKLKRNRGEMEVILGDRYKMRIGNKSFMVKRISYPGKNRGDGFQEAKTSAEVRELLKDDDGVKVVDFQFGFSDGIDSYYVAEWNETLTTTLAEYMTELQKQIRENANSPSAAQQLRKLQEKVQELKAKLADLRDFDTHNMAYDTLDSSIWLFDLNKK